MVIEQESAVQTKRSLKTDESRKQPDALAND